MSAAPAAVGLVMVAVGALVWFACVAALARANPDQRVAHPGNEGFGWYLVVYLTGFAVALLGCFALADTYGWWGYAGGVALFAAPALVLVRVHNRALKKASGAPGPR